MKTEIEILREEITKLCEIVMHVGFGTIEEHPSIADIINELKTAECPHCDKLADEIASIEKQLEESKKPKVYYCTICGKVPVDAENGFDTCDDCISKM